MSDLAREYFSKFINWGHSLILFSLTHWLEFKVLYLGDCNVLHFCKNIDPYDCFNAAHPYVSKKFALYTHRHGNTRKLVSCNNIFNPLRNFYHFNKFIS